MPMGDFLNVYNVNFLKISLKALGRDPYYPLLSDRTELLNMRRDEGNPGLGK